MSTPIPSAGVARDRLEKGTVIAPADWAALTDQSLRLIYAAIKSGAIPTIRYGQRHHIPAAWARTQLGL